MNNGDAYEVNGVVRLWRPYLVEQSDFEHHHVVWDRLGFRWIEIFYPEGEADGPRTRLHVEGTVGNNQRGWAFVEWSGFPVARYTTGGSRLWMRKRASHPWTMVGDIREWDALIRKRGHDPETFLRARPDDATPDGAVVHRLTEPHERNTASFDARWGLLSGGSGWETRSSTSTNTERSHQSTTTNSNWWR